MTTPTPDTVGGPACALCGARAAVHWQRRLTDTELQAAQQLEQDRRDQIVHLSDPALPPPTFGPLPGPTDFTRTVHGCAAHAITLDAASLVHSATCAAPTTTDLPGCNCTPEPAPTPVPDPDPVALPPGW